MIPGRGRFHLDNDQFVGAKVKNGSYAVDRVPAGTRRITVEGDGVPAKYSSEDRTPLTAAAEEGPSTLDFDLK